MVQTNVVISISSDIGIELVKSWSAETVNVIGSYRNYTEKLSELSSRGSIQLFRLDLANLYKDPKLFEAFIESIDVWDNLVFASGTQIPIGDFHKIDFESWKEGFEVNSLAQLKVLHALLPKKRPISEGKRLPTVLFFAGGGTNGPVVHYSAYTLAKISLIKMCELLDAEINDVKFSIIGPGWVKTKIHSPTILDSGVMAGDNYLKTLEMLDGEKCTSMQDVIDSCNWILTTNSRLLSGRNFSSLNDRWDSDSLVDALEQCPDMYKLRRFRNDWLKRKIY